MSRSEIAIEFHRAMLGIYESARDEIGYVATRFRQMVVEHGGVAAARQLLLSGPSDGFATLWEKKRLDLSVEFLVLQPRFHALFTDEERRIARDRLEQHRMDVDFALARVESDESLDIG